MDSALNCDQLKASLRRQMINLPKSVRPGLTAAMKMDIDSLHRHHQPDQVAELISRRIRLEIDRTKPTPQKGARQSMSPEQRQARQRDNQLNRTGLNKKTSKSSSDDTKKGKGKGKAK